MLNSVVRTYLAQWITRIDYCVRRDIHSTSYTSSGMFHTVAEYIIKDTIKLSIKVGWSRSIVILPLYMLWAYNETTAKQWVKSSHPENNKYQNRYHKTVTN